MVTQGTKTQLSKEYEELEEGGKKGERREEGKKVEEGNKYEKQNRCNTDQCNVEQIQPPMDG